MVETREDEIIRRIAAMENPPVPERNSEGKGILGVVSAATALLVAGDINEYVWGSIMVVGMVAYGFFRVNLKLAKKL